MLSNLWLTMATSNSGAPMAKPNQLTTVLSKGAFSDMGLEPAHASKARQVLFVGLARWKTFLACTAKSSSLDFLPSSGPDLLCMRLLQPLYVRAHPLPA